MQSDPQSVSLADLLLGFHAKRSVMTMWEDCSKPGEAEEKKSTPGVFVDEPESTLKPGIFVDQIQLGPFEDALGPPDELSTSSFWLRLRVRVWLHRWHHRSVTQRSLPTAVV